MTDYTKLVKALRERALRENEWYEHGGDIIEDAAAAIEELQAQLPKRGEWRLVTPDSYIFNGYRCSLCNELVYGMTNYCPNCGAVMEDMCEVQR